MLTERSKSELPLTISPLIDEPYICTEAIRRPTFDDRMNFSISLKALSINVVSSGVGLSFSRSCRQCCSREGNVVSFLFSSTGVVLLMADIEASSQDEWSIYN